MAGEDFFGKVMQLRNQGLTDNLIARELAQQGYPMDQVQAALQQIDAQEMPLPEGMSGASGMSMPEDNYPAYGGPSLTPPSAPGSISRQGDGNIYERIEEITENLVDEKWEELLSEVKKIVAWKEKIEEKQMRLSSDLEKLKEDFKVLHQGVLGRLEDYDGRMRDVGTELKAVGKVFKDVIPEFVENVKELSSIKNELKGNK